MRDEFRLSTIAVNEAALRERVMGVYGTVDGPAMLAALRADFPVLGATDRNGVVSGIGWRLSALHQLDLKVAQGGAGAYGYWFTYAPPLLDGRLGVPHCADIAYAFDNTTLADQLAGDTAYARSIADAMAGAILRFAETGNPGTAARPWPRHDARRATMVFDTRCAAVSDPAPHVFAIASRPG